MPSNRANGWNLGAKLRGLRPRQKLTSVKKTEGSKKNGIVFAVGAVLGFPDLPPAGNARANNACFLPAFCIDPLCAIVRRVGDSHGEAGGFAHRLGERELGLPHCLGASRFCLYISRNGP